MQHEMQHKNISKKSLQSRTIQEMENRSDCWMSTAYKIAEALGVSLDDLWIPDKKQAEESARVDKDVKKDF